MQTRLLATGTETHDVIAGPLRLAHTYRAQHVLQYLRSVLKCDWPATLPKWDSVDRFLATIPGPDPGTCLFAQTWPHFNLFAVKIIRLATECEVTEILPAAYYQFSRLLAQNARVLRQGTLASSAAAPEDLQKLLNGRDVLRSDVACWALALLTELSDGRQRLPAHFPCWDALSGWWCARVLPALLWGSGATDPRRSLLELSTAVQLSCVDQNPPCASCRTWTSNQLHKKRQEIWNSLPVWFGVV